jgi:hypothetical protein
LTPPDISDALWQPEQVRFSIGLTFFSKPAVSMVAAGVAASTKPGRRSAATRTRCFEFRGINLVVTANEIIASLTLKVSGVGLPHLTDCVREDTKLGRMRYQ